MNVGPTESQSRATDDTSCLNMVVFDSMVRTQCITPSFPSTLLSNEANTFSNSSEPANLRREVGHLGGRPRSLSNRQPAQSTSPQIFRGRSVSASSAVPPKQSMVSDYLTDVIHQPQPRSVVAADQSLIGYTPSPADLSSSSTGAGMPSWSIDQQHMQSEEKTISPGRSLSH
jgi:hypothetical protein